MIDEFKQFVHEHPSVQTFVDNVEAIECVGYDWVVRYLFDGYMDCLIAFDGEDYWDFADCRLPPVDTTNYTAWPSLFSLMQALEEMLSEPG